MNNDEPYVGLIPNSTRRGLWYWDHDKSKSVGTIPAGATVYVAGKSQEIAKSFSLSELAFEDGSELITWLWNSPKRMVDLKERKLTEQLLNIQSSVKSMGANLLLIDKLPEHFNSESYYESTGLDFQKHIRNTTGLEQFCDVMVYVADEDFKKGVSGDSVLVGKNRYGAHDRQSLVIE